MPRTAQQVAVSTLVCGQADALSRSTACGGASRGGSGTLFCARQHVQSLHCSAALLSCICIDRRLPHLDGEAEEARVPQLVHPDLNLQGFGPPNARWRVSGQLRRLEERCSRTSIGTYRAQGRRPAVALQQTTRLLQLSAVHALL